MAKAKSLKVASLDKQAKTEVPASVFGEEFHETLVHETARAEAAARRRGTASTLGRGEVAMTGAKAWRQKGTGRARVGALSVPHRRGGGVAFGPKPRGYTFKVNRKARRRALRAALSVHAARDSLAILDAANYKEPKTKQAAEALAKWGARQPTLVVINPDEETVLKSFRNIPRVTVLPASATGVVDIIGHRSLVISKAALEVLEQRAAEVKRGNGAAPASDEPEAKEAKPKAKAEEPKAEEEPAEEAKAEQPAEEPKAEAEEAEAQGEPEADAEEEPGDEPADESEEQPEAEKDGDA
ncbi:MAG TPA: 50S ribosomal protein L4 [Solirubrobacterales bacterium]